MLRLPFLVSPGFKHLLKQRTSRFFKIHNLFLDIFSGNVKCLGQAVQAEKHLAAPVYQFFCGSDLVRGQWFLAFFTVFLFFHMFHVRFKAIRQTHFMQGLLFCQAAQEQFAVMSGNGDDIIVFLDSQIFPGKDILHGKSVPGGVGDSGVRENAADFPLLIKQIIIGNDKFIV